VKLLVAARAEREINRKAASWIQNSKMSPDLFWSEVKAAVTRLSVEPYAGRSWISPRGRRLHRLLLPYTENHLYYSFDPERATLTIRCLWGARREREPSL
jgi:hypothetical protein